VARHVPKVLFKAFIIVPAALVPEVGKVGLNSTQSFASGSGVQEDNNNNNNNNNIKTWLRAG